MVVNSLAHGTVTMTTMCISASDLGNPCHDSVFNTHTHTLIAAETEDFF